MEDGGSEYSRIAAKFAAAKRDKKLLEEEEGKVDYQGQFKTKHLLTATFFLWILSLQVIGIYFFVQGFLLTRRILNNKSTCDTAPLDLGADCWYPKQFDKAVIIVIDALRYDFTVPTNKSEHYLNTLTILHETTSNPHDAILLPFIADPPTTTLQRLKGLTTGNLPTFIDVGENFAGTAIGEDNLIGRLREANKTIVHLGDDTWHALFPGSFDANLTHAYDSFNVEDLHTVDNGVIEHIFPLLEMPERWDVVIGHFLGVDHAGHRYGPDHPAMNAKLKQMDGVIRRMIDALDDETLLVIMGDHGMDPKGDHGGESDDEVEAGLWMFSKKGVFGRTSTDTLLPPPNAKIRPVAQIDLVPTLALLLGLPIPFNNLGAPIEEAFIGRDGNDWKNLAAAHAVTAAQIKRYQQAYAGIGGFDSSDTAVLDQSTVLYETAMEYWGSVTSGGGQEDAVSALYAFRQFQKENIKVCKSLFGSFSIPDMVFGIGTLLAGVLIVLRVASSPERSVAEAPILLRSIGIGSFAGILFARILSNRVEMSTLNICAAGFAVGGILGYAYVLIPVSRGSRIESNAWTWLAVVFTVSQSIGFASNSYTIWEDEILLCFLASFGIFGILASMRRENMMDRLLGSYQSGIFLFLTRLASLSRQCREEQIPMCKSTYYASSTSSTSAMWQLFIPYVVAVLLPAVFRSYYQATKNYEGPAVFWTGLCLRTGLFGSAMYWTLNAADDGDWLDLAPGTLKTIRMGVAQTVLLISFGLGTTIFTYARPCVVVIEPDIKANGAPGNKPVAQVVGYSNVHGSRYFLLFGAWLLAIILVQKPMGGGTIALLGWQVLTLLEIISTNDLHRSAIGPVVLGLLGNFYFFKTGHQAALASIQWDSAFIAVRTLVYPWSPLLVLLNSFGPQILCAIAVPLLVLWKRPARKDYLVDVTKALAVHILYYAVIGLATTMWAGWLRRHLMLYRIFAPRFMTGAGVLVIVDVVGIFVALVAFRANTLGIANVFGWV